MSGISAEREPRSESLYFRASQDLREDVDTFAARRGVTLSSAVGRLVERGLEAIANEESVKQMEDRLAQSTQELASMKVHLAAAQGEVQKWQAVIRGIEGYLRNLTVGACPHCKRQVTAYDHAVVRQCPYNDCRRPLEQVERAQEITPVAAGFLGAIGGLIVGLAAGQRQEGSAAGK